MRNNKFFDIMVGVTLIPLWIALLTRFLEKYPWLFYLATAITTVLVLVILVSLISSLLRKINACYIFVMIIMTRGTGCLNWARPGLWGLRVGDCPVLPGTTYALWRRCALFIGGKTTCS